MSWPNTATTSLWPLQRSHCRSHRETPGCYGPKWLLLTCKGSEVFIFGVSLPFRVWKMQRVQAYVPKHWLANMGHHGTIWRILSWPWLYNHVEYDWILSKWVPFHFEMKTFLLLRLFQKWLILVWMASWLVGLCGHSCHSCSFVFHVNYDALLTRPQFSQVNLLPSASLSSQWHCCHILAIPISPLENPTE